MIPMKKLKMTVKMIYGGNWGEKAEKRKNQLFFRRFRHFFEIKREKRNKRERFTGHSR